MNLTSGVNHVVAIRQLLAHVESVTISWCDTSLNVGNNGLRVRMQLHA